ncbi:MAG: ParB N-terminal domain-containing protein [Alphaproteobacteria bacterium]
MKLQHIELSRLTVSKANVRKHGGKDVGDLIASIRSLGVIQPLLVRRCGEGFEVIAGQRRLLACRALEAENGKAAPVPCAVLDTGDDAAAIEASLAENVARLPMEEIDQYKAFAALKAKGRTVADIAAQFGVTELLVRKRVAIANLIAPVLNAYRRGDIEVPTIRQLTMATKAQQKDWYRLFRDPEEYAPKGHALSEWLFGGAKIPLSSALFPVEQYEGSILSDLFGDEQLFDDAQKFWKRQMAVVMERQAAYLEAGWSDVIVMEIGDRFYHYDKVKRGKKEGGKIYISCAANGEIGFHEGWLDEKEAARRDRASAKAEGKGAKSGTDAQARPELTKAAIRYLELHRHNAVRNELLKSPQAALRLIAAHVVGGSSLWCVTPEDQNPDGNKLVAASVASCKAQTAFDTERKAMRELLGLADKPGFRHLMRPAWEPVDTCALFARLLSLSDEDVLRVLTFIMAEALEAGSAQCEALGVLLDVDMDKWWTPDDAFFDLLRDKAAINAMVAEIAGKQAAGAHVASTVKVQKGVIRACLDGTEGRKKVSGWKPRYMRFPMQAYTKRKGLPAIEYWNAVRKLLPGKS